MNYTINYSGSGMSGGHMTTPMAGSGQRTIVLTPPSQQASGNTNHTNSNQQSTYPLMFDVGHSNAPVYYTYQSPDTVVNHGIANSNDNNIGQVVLSPLSPVPSNVNMQGNSTSPNLQAISITSDNKAGAARSLNEVFNVQGINTVAPSIVPANTFPNTSIPPGNKPTEIVNLLSSLQPSGLHIIENGNGKVSTPSPTVPSVTKPVQGSELNPDNRAVSNFITTLHNSGF